MDEIKSLTPAPAASDQQNATTTDSPEPLNSARIAAPAKVALHQLYGQPAPIRTFPLPSFYPNNPISLFHVVVAWVSQALFPPPLEPSVTHTGVWSPETRSVHITDPKSIRALWEQGFYGKGSYSRSEPNWLKREQIRQGLVEGNVSEQMTNKRRTERIQAKWERAREEQEAIERTKQEEARLANTIINGLEDGQASAPTSVVVLALPPVGPQELLALPNSARDLALSQLVEATQNDLREGEYSEINGLQTTALSHAVHPAEPIVAGLAVTEASINPSPVAHDAYVNGVGKLVNGTDGQAENSAASPTRLNGVKPETIEIPTTNGSTSSSSTTLVGQASPLKRRKSVRFSPKVESTTFQLSDPPSPYLSPANSMKNSNGGLVNGTKPASPIKAEPKQEVAVVTPETPRSSSPAIVDKEHLQLAPEEAFFLVFALGALCVVDAASQTPLPTLDIFTLLRQHSYFPPRISPVDLLLPDDPFLMHYVVYHHFRSLGWVPRSGVKFGVDWLLYQRGPVFDHAEFGLIVLPAYSDPRWAEQGRAAPRRSWHWLHGVNRVLNHVLKSLVLVYVDIPPPAALEDAELQGRNITSLLSKYKVREIMVRRWSSNRNR